MGNLVDHPSNEYNMEPLVVESFPPHFLDPSNASLSAPVGDVLDISSPSCGPLPPLLSQTCPDTKGSSHYHSCTNTNARM